MYNSMIGDTSFMGYSTVETAATNGTVGAAPRVQTSASVVIDGTPLRVVAIAVAAAASITALRWAGFRFNVGASL